MRIIVLCAAALMVGAAMDPAPACAEHLRLANGRYLQGEIAGEPTDEGVRFKVTATGGEVFLRWSQLSDADTRRLRKIEDPEADLRLMATVKGSRLELLTGEILEGDVKDLGSTYLLNNLAFKDRKIPKEDVESWQKDVDIDATSVKKPALLLADELAARPPATAVEHYRLARLAERLGLYEEAKGLIDDCIAANPTGKLQTLAEQLSATLDEIIKHQSLLAAIKYAREFERKKVYQNALDLIDTIVKESRPTGEVLAKLTQTREEIDANFTEFVINEWFVEMKRQAKAKVRDRKLTVQAALAWSRSEYQNAIINALAETTKGKAGNIKQRFDGRIFEKVTRRSAKFGRDGWYDIVGGPLPSAGKTKEVQPPPGRRPGGGNRPFGAGSPGSPDEERSGSGDQDVFGTRGEAYQSKPDDPQGLNREIIDELIRKMAEEDAANKGQGKQAARPAYQRPNYQNGDPRLQVPETCPTIDNWWASAGTSARADWVMAAFVLYGGTMHVVKESYDTMYFK